jgi:F like protein
VTEPVSSTEEDANSLIPAILAAYAAYQAYRGAHDSLPSGDWIETAGELGLKTLVYASLLRVAYRALTRQRSAAGRPGDELLRYTNQAAEAGAEAGLRTLAQGIVWNDQVTQGDPVTKDAAQPGERGALPTEANPPGLLAEMTAGATADMAQFRAAELAGWRKVTWVSMRDNRVRETHRALDGQTVNLGTPFLSPSGAKLRFPHDPRAPIGEVAGCRCYLRASRR